MAIWDNLLRRNVEKAAPMLPAGAQVSQFTQQELSGVGYQPYSIGIATALPQPTYLAGIPFGPSTPLIPAAINPVGADGRPEPRRWEYPVAWNIFVSEQRVIPWNVLRTAGDQIDILRRCVEVLKSRLNGMNWDITFSDSASELIAAESGGDHVRAMQKARDEYTEEIARLRAFWQTPDRINGLGFKDWLGMALEEVLVLDALAVYPHPDLKGDLHSFEILDGSTIKPLLDDRGMRPQHPFPAYQQILYGFPRGEFIASSDDPTQDGNFSADEMIYLVRNRRTFTPYGYSPVERALPLADLYLKRQQWLRAEFTDGVMPDLMFESDPQFGGTPELLRAWENILNDDLAGQTEQRKRARIIPSGLKAIDNTGHSEKFNDTFDNHLIKGITGHFGILPSEIGYADGGTLGGAGQQNGEAKSGDVIGVEPLMLWLADQLSDLSYKFLGMPRELVFRFNGGRETDTETDARRVDIETRGARKSLNEARAEMGLPLIDSPAADALIMNTSAGLYMVTSGGLVSVDQPSPAPEGQVIVPTSSQEEEALDSPAVSPLDDEESLEESVKAEKLAVGNFVSWGSSGGKARGKITRIAKSGSIKVPDSSFSINATEEDPAALIRVYQRDGDYWKESKTIVGHKLATLTRIEELRAKPKDAEKIDQESAQEVKAFLKWAKKGNTERDFEFLAVDAFMAKALNQSVREQDSELTKALADGVLKKA